MLFLDLYLEQEDGSYKLATVHESELDSLLKQKDFNILTKEDFINAYID